jgi:putative hydrolase
VDQLLAAMTIVEGYAEHVMDAVGDELDPGYAELRRRLERDRERRGPLDSLVSKLLGLEMKMAQYKRGKAFADEVVSLAGIRALNTVWSEPEALPTMEELDTPSEWIERTGAAKQHRRFALFR